MMRAPAALTLAASLWAFTTPAPGSPAASLQPGVEQLKPFIAAGIADSLGAAQTLRAHLAAQDLAGAQQAWIASRSGWERAEIVSDEFFPDLDDAIDSWPNGKIGFHAIEARLFGARKTDVGAEADDLIANLAAFGQKLDGTTLTAQGLLNGTVKLAYEIGENKADGGESQISGTSLGDIRANLAGIAEAYRLVFGPALRSADAARDTTVAAALARLTALVAASDLKSLDETALSRESEELALALQDAAAPLGLKLPSLGN